MRTPWWQPVLFAALAGGMGWGIRGQYGHETGAMIAGLLVSLTLIYLLCPRSDWPSLFRAAAWGTLAMGIGGSMTYGQTLGLTHDPNLVGNDAAYWWGLLGCAVKGGIWIGIGGLFLGMGLGGVRYRPGEMLLFLLALVGMFYMGIALLNEPFDPAAKELPAIYFSDHWHWEPGKALEPRPEVWGGLLAVLAAGIIYTAVARKDALARNMALWGVLGGAIGFPLGQSVQAWHAWNPEVFTQGFWVNLEPHINWWNMMETTFGAVMGAVLGLGLWMHRRRIRLAPISGEDRVSLPTEMGVLVVHLPLLISVAFVTFRPVDALYDWGIVMIILPVVAVTGGRVWPFLQLLPLTLLPIAGKTLRDLAYTNDAIAPVPGWVVYLIIPVGIALAVAVYLARKVAQGALQRDPVGPLLLLCAWGYFLLNFAIFRFPWPWAEWTARTPNAIIFTICIVGLTIMVAVGLGRKNVAGQPEAPAP
ncbi:MAG: hypothetical protein ACLFTT_04045 [Candidatus Hydrogenedentota bacterium]